MNQDELDTPLPPIEEKVEAKHTLRLVVSGHRPGSILATVSDLAKFAKAAGYVLAKDGATEVQQAKGELEVLIKDRDHWKLMAERGLRLEDELDNARAQLEERRKDSDAWQRDFEHTLAKNRELEKTLHQVKGELVQAKSELQRCSFIRDEWRRNYCKLNDAIEEMQKAERVDYRKIFPFVVHDLPELIVLTPKMKELLK